MTRTVKGILIGCAALVVLAAVAVFLAVRYVSANKDRLLAQGEALRAAGQAFGKSRRESECVAEALSRYRGDRSMMGGIRTRLWLSGCLEGSSLEPDFCAAVPPRTEFIQSATWRVAQCAKHGLEGDSTCPNILDEVQQYCASPKRTRKVPSP